jgi:hypothetical protein
MPLHSRPGYCADFITGFVNNQFRFYNLFRVFRPAGEGRRSATLNQNLYYYGANQNLSKCVDAILSLQKGLMGK